MFIVLGEAGDDIEAEVAGWRVGRAPTGLSTSAHRLHHCCSTLLQLNKHWALPDILGVFSFYGFRIANQQAQIHKYPPKSSI